MFTPSQHQQDFFDWVETGKGSAILVAVAGAGKTTTVVEAFKRIPENRSTVYLVFNKRNQEEAAQKVPGHVRAMTFHSAGFSAYRRAMGNVQIDNKKVWNLIRQHCTKEEAALYGGFVAKLVGLAKQAGVGFLVPDDPRVWFDIMEHFDLYTDSEEAEEAEGVELARAILKLNREQTEILDFDDMLYMPLVHKCRMWQNDWVFVDEAQDTNAVQRAMLKKMLKHDGRLVAVGDPAQAIYGFRGADGDSLYKIREAFGCVEMPLTVSFRCPQTVVKAAQQYVSHIQAHESAPEGVVRWSTLAEAITAGINKTDAIVCRTTAPLVDVAFTLIGKGIGCHVLGREIGQGLITLITKQKAKGIDALEEKLEAFMQRETAKWLAKDREDKVQALQDRIACIHTVISHLDENHRTVPALIQRLEELFSDSNGRVTLCTVHKAKGLEWNRVFLLYPNVLMPSPWARQEWQKVQENNLIYVAYTRAKQELVFIK